MLNATFDNLQSLIDRFTHTCGQLLGWLVYAMMFVTVTVVVLRYGFAIGSIALQESVTYLHASVFLLGSAYTLQRGGHVRVDIFYRNFSARRKALVDLVGTLLFLLPVCGFIFYSSLDYVGNAWAIREASVESEGIPAVFMLKTLIPVMATLLLIQALAEIIRNAKLLQTVDRPAEGSLQKTAESSLSETAEGSSPKAAEGSLTKAAEGSLSDTAEGYLPKAAEGSSQKTADKSDDS